MSRRIILQDISGDSPNTQVQLPVAEDKEGYPRWREFRAPRMPPRISQGTLQWSHTDPLQDFAWSMDDWSGGALAAWARPGAARYAIANGVDARWEGVLSLGASRYNGSMTTAADDAYRDRDQFLGFVIRDGGGESQAPTSYGWTAGTGATITSSTTQVRTGTYAIKIVTDGGRSIGNVLMSQALHSSTESPIAAWQSMQLTVYANIKNTAGDAANARLTLTDGVDTTNGTASNSTNSWEEISVTHTVNAGATELTLQIQAGWNESAASTMYLDDIRVVPAGGVTCTGMAEHADRLYAAFGRCLARWDGTGGIWRVVHIHASAAITDLATFANKIYVAYGAGVAYEYGTVGATAAPATDWTARATGDTDAIHFAVARNANGTPALWKNDAADTIKSCTDPTEAGSAWTSGLTVGTADHAINRLYGAFDTLVVGKEDGLYGFMRWDPANSAGDNLVYEITGEVNLFPSTNNFADGVVWNGWLWLTTQQGLVRWRPGYYENLSRLFTAPRALVSPGRVRALAAAPDALYLVTDQGVADITVRQPYLCSITAEGDELRLHILHYFPNTASTALNPGLIVDRLGVFGGAASASLVLLGRTYTGTPDTFYPADYRWILPPYGGAPYNQATVDVEASGYIDLPQWHGEMPDTAKAFIAFTILCRGLSATNTLKVEYGLNGGSITTYTLGTFNTAAAVQTLYFNTLASPTVSGIGRSIQLRLTFSAGAPQSGAGSALPQLFAFALHSTLRPERLKTWEVFVRVEDEGILESGLANPEAKQSVLTDLNTLETQTYPIILMEDLDDVLSPTSTTVYIMDRERVEVEEGAEIHRLLLQEANTS